MIKSKILQGNLRIFKKINQIFFSIFMLFMSQKYWKIVFLCHNQLGRSMLTFSKTKFRLPILVFHIFSLDVLFLEQTNKCVCVWGGGGGNRYFEKKIKFFLES